MLSLVVTLLIIALIAAVLGFGGIAGAAVGIAEDRLLRRPRPVHHFADCGRHARRLRPAPLSPAQAEIGYADWARCRTSGSVVASAVR